MEGIENGHYGELEVWERQFFLIAITHCEGPDHLARMDRVHDLSIALQKEAPEVLKEGYLQSIGQAERVRDVIRRFGRHPHRNAILGRPDTIDEAPYIAQGRFPHERDVLNSDA